METEVILGPGGCGKTTLIQRRMEATPNYAVLTSTSGISAINLGAATTINSVVGYFDTQSLQDNIRRGYVREKLYKLRDNGYTRVVIDEISMMSATVLDLLYKQFDQAGLGMVLTGDFLQLPAVNEKYAFESECWPQFINVQKLDKIWRQSDPSLLEAVTMARAGRGVSTVRALRKARVSFADEVDKGFEGLTVFATNRDADKFNEERAALLKTPEVSFPSKRWGVQRSEWKTHIPAVCKLKLESLVMILANNHDGTGGFGVGGYVNGDLGYLVSEAGGVLIKRRGIVQANETRVYRVVRKVHAPSLTPEQEAGAIDWMPAMPYGQEYEEFMREHELGGRCYFDTKRDSWVVGEISYMPLRAGYASTVHKAQGLSVPYLQIVYRSNQMAKPALSYTALTRCVNVEGLRLVGTEFAISNRFVNDPRCLPYV